MSDQYTKLVGYTLKYPYLVGITTDSGNFGTGILISPRFVLTAGHVLQDSAWIEVISTEGSTSARTQKINEPLDLALLELERPISVPKAEFMDSPLQPGVTLLAVGVQPDPGQPDALAVAEIKLTLQNKTEADGKILDMQLEGGARPGYSGGPVVVEKGGALRCVGVTRLGGHSATTNAIGLARIRAFVEEYIPDILGPKSDVSPKRMHWLLIFNTFLFGALAVGAITGWHYLAPPSEKGIGDPVVSGTPSPTPVPTPSPPVPTPTPRPPYIKVWVNIPTHVYHCPGDPWYGKTKNGRFMRQVDAQNKGNRPSYGHMCN